MNAARAKSVGTVEKVDGRYLRWLLRLADTALILAQQLGKEVGHAPSVEEDMALANLGLDQLGQARALLCHAGELEGVNRDEDMLAFLRTPEEFYNLTLAEQPNLDFAYIVVRQLLLTLWQSALYDALASPGGTTDERVAAIAAKAGKEVRYHIRFAGGWLVRLGDGTQESHRRVQTAVDNLWRFTAELLTADEVDDYVTASHLAPDLRTSALGWSAAIDEWLTRATLTRPPPSTYTWFGKGGQHTEALGHILGPMQQLQRTYPGNHW